MTTATRTQPTAEQQNQRQQREQRDERLTKIRQTRRAWDCIIAAHYHYTRDPKLGYRSVAKMFNMPMGTVRHIVARTNRDDPDVRHAAMRFGLIKVNIRGIGSDLVGVRQNALSDLLSGLGDEKHNPNPSPDGGSGIDN